MKSVQEEKLTDPITAVLPRPHNLVVRFSGSFTSVNKTRDFAEDVHFLSTATLSLAVILLTMTTKVVVVAL